MTRTELDQSIMTGKPFEVHSRGLLFSCTARGHRQGREMVIDDVTVIETYSKPFSRWALIQLHVDDRVFCEEMIQEDFPDIIKAALAAAELEGARAS